MVHAVALRSPAAQALFLRRHELGLSQEDVANEAGVISQRTVSELERGKYGLESLTMARVVGLAKALRWTLWDLQKETGADFGVPAPGNAVEVSEVHRVPVRSMAAAGTAFYHDTSVIDYEYVAADSYRLGMLVVEICGDSMEPTAFEGERAFVDTRDVDLHEGGIYLFNIVGDGFAIKRARRLRGEWYMLSDNLKYPPLSREDVQIVGRVYKFSATRDVR